MSDYSINYDYKNKYLDLLKEIILEKFKDTDSKIFLFGSRARHEYRRDSNYDIGVENIDKKKFIMLKWDIESYVEESIIPHFVDLVNFDESDESFKSMH